MLAIVRIQGSLVSRLLGKHAYSGFWFKIVLWSGKNKVRRPQRTLPSSRRLSGRWQFCALLKTKEKSLKSRSWRWEWTITWRGQWPPLLVQLQKGNPTEVISLFSCPVDGCVHGCVNRIYEEGEKTEMKANPENVAEAMRIAIRRRQWARVSTIWFFNSPAIASGLLF